MPDYFPVFDAAHKRVFNADGLPVFGRVRAGSLEVPLSVQGWTDNQNVIPGGQTPAGSVSVSGTFSLARTGYKTFTPYNPGFGSGTKSAMTYIGVDGVGKQWYLQTEIYYISTLYSGSGFTGFGLVFSALVKLYYLNSGNYVSWSGFDATWYNIIKSSDIYVPDGSYSSTTPDKTRSDGLMGLNLTVPISATFNET